MKKNNRRQILKAGLAGLASVPLLGSLTGYSQQMGKLPIKALDNRVGLITGAPGNVIAVASGGGFVLIDSGAMQFANGVQAALEGGPVHTLFNTHYHADQTGGNSLFAEAGAVIYSHEITREWLSSDFYVPAQDFWISALPEPARPTQTFRVKGEMTSGTESIEYGYLPEAHTRGDIYVFLRDSNVLAVGDVASPLRDPSLDWFAGGWLGGRVDGMDELLAVSNNDTKIVPAYGLVMTRHELQVERDMMMHFYERTTELTTQGRSAQDILDDGVMDEVDRRFADPYRFLYDVRKGLWAHYLNFGGNIV